MGVGGQLHAPAALPPGMTRYLLYRRVGTRAGLDGCEKISPPPGFDPRTESLYRLRYPSPVRDLYQFFRCLVTLLYMWYTVYLQILSSSATTVWIRFCYSFYQLFYHVTCALNTSSLNKPLHWRYFEMLWRNRICYYSAVCPSSQLLLFYAG
jgi:hypothetical protein